MPTYEYLCDPDDGGCGNVIELICPAADKPTKRPKSCRKCRKRKAIRELFGLGNGVHIPVTLGSLAEKRGSKMSADEKHHLTEKFNEYKRPRDGEPSWVQLPGGKMINTAGKE